MKLRLCCEGSKEKHCDRENILSLKHCSGFEIMMEKRCDGDINNAQIYLCDSDFSSLLAHQTVVWMGYYYTVAAAAAAAAAA